VAVDPLSNAYVAGLTQSGDFPLRNPFQNFNAGSFGGLVSKVSSGWVSAVFSGGSWYVDRNRNGGFDGTAAGDQTFTFGQQGDIPVTGDWNGSGTFKIGVFRKWATLIRVENLEIERNRHKRPRGGRNLRVRIVNVAP